MKRKSIILCLCLSIFSIFLLLSSPIMAQPSIMPSTVYGDLNNDGACNSTDYSVIKQYLLDIIETPANPQYEKYGDLNVDGEINSIDSFILRRYILGYIETLPLIAPTPSPTPTSTPNPNLEIERKFLVKTEKIPYDLSTFDKYALTQAYISFSPEIRVRKANDWFYLCIKTPVDSAGMIREEHEYFITEEEYLHLLKKTEGNVITKDRYQGQIGKYIYAFDIYSGYLQGLAVLEVGFDSEEEANSFVPPDWIEKDVTSDKRYKNGNLARYGLPNPE